ncbi:MAG TPA: winged helix-turn-helix domain-containing protein, partial [Actinomycetota bacterium]|nr:winged helix-turn-helix domain-containing protein [Actinomycetota bacterium]
SGSGGGGTARGRGRPRGSGNRAPQALKLVTDNPGIPIPDMAQRMGIQVNYLYRVLPNLEQDGKVRKEGRGWFPKGS